MSYHDLYANLPTKRSIRLLRLQSGLGENGLACSLEVVEDFQSGPAYHALSYCNANDVVGLLCNQHRIYITKNLYAALHRLREREQNLPIWADAICIDQKNIAERNQQVSIMDHIYSSAAMVHVWLGHGNADTPRAITMIQRIVQRMHATPGYPDEEDSWLAEFTAPDARGDVDSWVTRLYRSGDSLSIVHATVKFEATDFDDQDWAAFYEFYQADWFSRVWVIQEVQQAKDARLLCGDFELSWDWAGLAAAKVRADATGDYAYDWTKSGIPSLEPFLNAEAMWNRVHWTRMQNPFLSLLDTGRIFCATDPRDKVFALLHHRIKQNEFDDMETISHSTVLSDPTKKEPSTHLNLEANYRMTLLNVYREVAVQSIQRCGNLEVLNYAWETAPYDPLWPSWIARWDLTCGQGVAAMSPFLYSADRQHRAKYDVYYLSKSLKVHGFQIGTICEKSFTLKYPVTENTSFWTKKDRVKEKLSTMLNLITRDCRQPNRYDDNDAYRAGDYGFMPTHFADFCSFSLQRLKANLTPPKGGPFTSPVNVYHLPNEDFDICNSCFQKVSKWLPYTRDIIHTLKKYAEDGQSERFYHQATNCCRRIAFFQTGEGFQGSTSENIELGDAVVVLLGSRVPIILRKHGSAYRLVSDAYVEGFMDGRAIDMWENGELAQGSFEIR